MIIHIKRNILAASCRPRVAGQKIADS